jgi:monovalent cation:H+ antiporter, CPA1 family
MHDSFHIDVLVVLLMVTSAVAMTVKWIRLPYSIALVIVGLICGVFHLLPPVEMSPELILLIFLPALLFEAAWNMDLRLLRQNAIPISVLATLGVLISMIIVAYCLHLGAAMPLGAAFLFGAMISATDPISVLALFRKMGMNQRLTMILEGESLFNDGTAVVLFNIVLGIVMANAELSIPAAVGSFLAVVVGGAAVGGALGFLASKITSFFDDHLLEITLTTILAYGSYLLAEQARVSPVISVLTAGIVMGNFGSRAGMSATTRIAVNSFWEYAAFVVNSLVFLLIGLQVKFDLLAKYILPIGVGIGAILIARAVIVYGLTPFLSNRHYPIPWSWRNLLFWGGIRGSLCMALALSLPTNFPGREAVIITTFGVVLFTLLLPGLTMQPLVTLFRMNVAESKLHRYKELKTELMLNQASLDALQQMLADGSLSKAVYEKLSAELRDSQRVVEEQIEQLHLGDASIQNVELTATRRKLLEFRKDLLSSLKRQGAISEETMHKLRTDIDAKLADASIED